MKKVLCCPSCKKKLEFFPSKIICKKCGSEYQIKDSVLIFLNQNILSSGEKLSSDKWNIHYNSFFNKLDRNREKIEINNVHTDIRQIGRYYKIKKNDLFLELGSGPAFYCQEYSKLGMESWGIDLSFPAVKKSQKRLALNKIKKSFVVCGDIQKMPFKDNSFDLIFGGGVIEHLKEQTVIMKEIKRILKPNGVIFNTVPLLNIGTLTYRQIWGNIPYFPVIKQLAELIHIKLLGGRHMQFGLEYSFTPNYLKKIHKNVGFKEIQVKKLEVDIEVNYIKSPILRKIAIYLAKNSPLFWPMVYVVAKK